MKTLVFIIRYLKYLFKAKTVYSVHSPFVFDVVSNVIQNQKRYYAYNEVEALRSELLSSSEIIEVNDFGANSKKRIKKRKVKEIAAGSAKSAKYGQLLFRLVNQFKPQYVLELGTSLGISTLYQALPNKNAKFISIEGCPNISSIALKNFQKFNLNNIELITGNFDEILESVLKKFHQIDYVFFDGNHTKESTLKYFGQCAKLSHNNTIFVFDDINWSDEMQSAWECIKAHPKVKITIDLFFLGLVFFRQEQEKEDFVIMF